MTSGGTSKPSARLTGSWVGMTWDWNCTHPNTGGCRDALHVDRVNQNQGAESTLAFLLSLAELRLTQNSVTTFNQPADLIQDLHEKRQAQRTEVVLHPDRKRVLLRPFLLANEPPGAAPGAAVERALRICASVTALPEMKSARSGNRLRPSLASATPKPSGFS